MHQKVTEKLQRREAGPVKARRRVYGRFIGQPRSDCQHGSGKKMTSRRQCLPPGPKSRNRVRPQNVDWMVQSAIRQGLFHSWPRCPASAGTPPGPALNPLPVPAPARRPPRQGARPTGMAPSPPQPPGSRFCRDRNRCADEQPPAARSPDGATFLALSSPGPRCGPLLDGWRRCGQRPPRIAGRAPPGETDRRIRVCFCLADRPFLITAAPARRSGTRRRCRATAGSAAASTPGASMSAGSREPSSPASAAPG